MLHKVLIFSRYSIINDCSDVIRNSVMSVASVALCPYAQHMMTLSVRIQENSKAHKYASKS